MYSLLVFTKTRKCVLWKSITERDTILFLNILSSVARARGLWKPRFKNTIANELKLAKRLK